MDESEAREIITKLQPALPLVKDWIDKKAEGSTLEKGQMDLGDVGCEATYVYMKVYG